MPTILKNAIVLLGFSMCIIDVQTQEAENNLFAGNFFTNQTLWLALVRYGLCGATIVLAALTIFCAPKLNLGILRHQFVFRILIIFCVITSIRSAIDMGSGIFLFATGPRHILAFALVAMASSLSQEFNFARPLLIGAFPAFLIRFIYATGRYIAGDGFEIAGGVRSVALDTGFTIFGLFYLFIAIDHVFKNIQKRSLLTSSAWIISAIPLLALPIASFRRGMIVLVLGSLTLGLVFHLIISGRFIRRFLPTLTICVAIVGIGVSIFAIIFGKETASERIRSFMVHEDGALAQSNIEYQLDFDYAVALIEKNPFLGIGFSLPYGLSGRDSNINSMVADTSNELVLHVGMLELVVRQGIWGGLIWLLAFLWIPIRWININRGTTNSDSLFQCLSMALFFLISNIPTSPPFYNEIRPAVFLGIALGIAFAPNPSALLQSYRHVMVFADKIWKNRSRQSRLNVTQIPIGI